LRSSSEARTLNCMKRVLFVLCLLAGCGDGGEPATRVDVDAGGTGGGSVAGAPGSGGAAAATGGTVGSGGATGGTIGTGGVQATGGTPGTGGTSAPNCAAIALANVSGPAVPSVVGGSSQGPSDSKARCAQQATTDSTAMSPVANGVPAGSSGWTEAGYSVAPSGADCVATITYTRSPATSYTGGCMELVTLKVTVTK
jgi:hypothetical protein